MICFERADGSTDCHDPADIPEADRARYAAIVAGAGETIDPNPPPRTRPPLGPGGHLAAVLARLGVAPPPGCACRSRAAEMDARGLAWCRDNTETILGWLRDGAAAAGIPWRPGVAALVLRIALDRAARG